MPDRRNSISALPRSARRPERFDPTTLARSVIAIPLLEQIIAEAAATEEFLASHPAMGTTPDAAAVILNGSDKSAAESAYERVLKLRDDAVKYIAQETGGTVAVSERGRKKKSPKGANRAVAGEDKNVIYPPQKVGEAMVCVAELEGRVIRVMIAMDRDSPEEVISAIWPTRHDVIIDVNLAFKPKERVLKIVREVTEIPTDPDVRRVAKKIIGHYIDAVKKRAIVVDPHQRVDHRTSEMSEQYVFAQLQGKVITAMVALDEEAAMAMAHLEVLEGLHKKAPWALELVKTPPKVDADAIFARLKPGDNWVESLLAVGAELAEALQLDKAKLNLGALRAIYRIWPDFSIYTCQNRNLPTVKADAAQRAFAAAGANITWAVIDTGIDGDHPHFTKHKNIDKGSSYHKDFTKWLDADLAAAAAGDVPPDDGPGGALIDRRGHGTHVAGIIAGEQERTKDTGPFEMQAILQELGNDMRSTYKEVAIDSISGVAPKCRLVSLKVLDDFGAGKSKHIIAALSHIQRINGHGRELHIHGVNISAGYPFEAKWFACGHSPLCVEINRLVKSGVVVVVAAGNTGYGKLDIGNKVIETCLDLTINDPGNAAEAITVGSTHRDEPHRYGVSYFSSKGPTGDGRLKPDLLAPGEKILSCAVPGSKLSETDGNLSQCRYLETSGTSMAAPHVSGAIAAFLSIRGEFIGQAERLKQIFMSTATDLGRDRYFQGAGLVDLMRAIQSI